MRGREGRACLPDAAAAAAIKMLICQAIRGPPLDESRLSTFPASRLATMAGTEVPEQLGCGTEPTLMKVARWRDHKVPDQAPPHAQGVA